MSKSREDFCRELLKSRAPSKVHPRRVASSHLLSGLVKCSGCRRALTGQESKGGKFAYYVCNSLLKRGSGACDAPRLNSRRFERLVVDQIRENILTESNMRELVRLVDEEMDGVAHEHRQKLEAIESELAEVRRRLDRLYNLIETTELDMSDVTPRIREHREKQERLEASAEEARATLSDRRERLDDVETVTAFARDMSDFLMESEFTETKAFIRSFVKEIAITPGRATIRYTIPMPCDSRIPGMDSEEVPLPNPVLRLVNGGGAEGIRTPDLRCARAALSQLSYSPTLLRGSEYLPAMPASAG